MRAVVMALGKSQLKSGKTSVLKRRCRGWAVAQAEWRSGVCRGVGGVVVVVGWSEAQSAFQGFGC